MEFTDFKELKKLMAGSVNDFEFEEREESESYDKGLIYSYANWEKLNRGGIAESSGDYYNSNKNNEKIN